MTRPAAVTRLLQRNPDATLHELITAAGDMVVCYVDSDWASCLIKRKSRTGCIIEFLGQIVAWISEMQTATAQSSTESEYYGIVKAGKLLKWMQNVLGELGLPMTVAAPVHCDNQGAIALVNGSAFSRRSKHMDIAYHVARQWVEEGLMKVHYMPTEDMPADFLTKNLPGPRFKQLRSVVMGTGIT